MNGGTIILVAGIGIAGFLWYRSQLAQQAALAAAQSAPGPGLAQKLVNTAKPALAAAAGIVGRNTNPISTARNVLTGNTSSTGGWNPNRRAVSPNDPRAANLTFFQRSIGGLV